MTPDTAALLECSHRLRVPIVDVATDARPVECDEPATSEVQRIGE
jgi:hypothetical protein